MTLKNTTHNSGSTAVQLTACPVEGCGEEFPEHSGAKRRFHLLQEHDPSDFQL